MNHIQQSLQTLLPENKVSGANKPGCVDISIYSNHLTQLIGYAWNAGPKNIQDVSVPTWIKNNMRYSRECLRGLLQTDGCIYNDRGYIMVNFTNVGKRLSDDVLYMMRRFGYSPRIQKTIQYNGNIRNTIRLSKDVKKFIAEIDFWKA